MTVLLEVEDIELRFGGVTALAGVSFTVEAGERLALAGPNGAGKTSVLNCISGVEQPSSGCIRFGGTDVRGLRPSALAALGMGRTLQGLGVVDDFDVLSNLLLGRHHLSRAGLAATALRLPKARREEAAHRKACRAVAERLELAGELQVPARRLPAGARKRLELGRALAMEPRVLLLDEPFAGATPADVATMGDAIRQLSQEGAGVILVDHDLEAVTHLTDRSVVLDAGRVVTTAPTTAARR